MVLPFGPVAKVVIIWYYTLVTSSKQLDTLCAYVSHDEALQRR